MKKILMLMLVLSVAFISCDSGGSDGGGYTPSGEKFYNSAGAENDAFGSSVAISADGLTMVTGELKGAGASDADQGAAFVYVNTDSTWSLAAKLTVSDGAADDSFGYSVAISGDGSTVVVGARHRDLSSNSNSGAVYVFERPGGGWVDATETACLSVDGTPAGYYLGVSVAISSDGSTIAAGAEQYYAADADGGAVYIFEKPGGEWIDATQTAKLTQTDNTGNTTRFGYSVSISGDGSIVLAGGGAIEALYVYVKPGTGWADTDTQDAKLTASDNDGNSELGVSVSISSDGSTIVGGAYRPNYSGGGAVYVYAKPAGDWADATEGAKLKPTDSADSDYFGEAVAVTSDGGMILSGMRANNSAYVFEKPGAVWTSSTTEKYKLEPEDGDLGNFGSSVAMTATIYVVGSPDSDITNSKQGAVYIFE